MGEINFFNEELDFQLISSKNHTQWILKSIENEGFELGEVNYIFCSDEYLLNINKNYLNHNYYTDIISFNYVDNQTVSGDLFISIERVKENAESLNLKFEQELSRVMIHGILHLMGYNDKATEEQAVMRAKEDFYLALQSDFI